MGIITKPYTFSNGAGNSADATQVNADLDTLYTLVNGNIETANLKDGAITLLKLASEVKVIESVTHTPLTASYTLTNTETTFMTQNITLSTQRYCLFLFSAYCTGTGVYISLYDGATMLAVSGDYTSASRNFNVAKHVFKQLASGTHTIYIKGSYIGTSGTVYGDTNGTETYLTTIVFAF